MDETRTVITTLPDGAKVLLPTAEELAKCDWWTTLPRETDADKALLGFAMADSDQKAEDVIGAEFPLQHVLFHPVQLLDEDSGEIVDAIRSVLLGPDGKSTAFVSTGIIKSMSKVASIWGHPPYDPPLIVTVRQRKTRGKNITYDLIGLRR